MSFRRSASISILSLFAMLMGIVPATAQHGHQPQQQASPEAAASPVAASAWQIDTVTVVDIAGTPVSLSPDGRMLAGLGPDKHLCIWDVVDFEPTCDSTELPIMEDSIAWSPDSSAVAFSLDAFLRGYESDIYVFELATGASLNLTDDGLEGGLFDSFDSDDPMPVDVTPTWSLDSQSLLFSRSDMGGDRDVVPTELMRIDRTGGEPEHVATLYADGPFAVYTQMFLLSDGSLVYALNPSDLSDPDSGVWVLTPDGESSQVMAAGPDTAFPVPIITDVFEGNGTLMATGFSGYNVGQFSTVSPLAFVLELNSGDVTPLEGDPDTMQNPAQSVFSPDGATTLSVVFGPTEGDQVLLMGAQREEVDLGPGAASESAGGPRWRGPEWREGNIVFVARGMLADPYLLTMTPADAST